MVSEQAILDYFIALEELQKTLPEDKKELLGLLRIIYRLCYVLTANPLEISLLKEDDFVYSDNPRSLACLMPHWTGYSRCIHVTDNFKKLFDAGRDAIATLGGNR